VSPILLTWNSGENDEEQWAQDEWDD